MQKKGLLVIYSPQHLIQFIWYYCTYGYNKKWDALCLPNGFSATNIKDFCEKSGIFENVYFNEKYFLESSLKERFLMLSKMLSCSFMGRKRKYIKHFLDEYIDTDIYDEINVLSDHALISGGFVALSDEKKVVIMEDGICDYQERSFSNIYKKPFNVLNTEGFVLALLGYANVAFFYPMKENKNCIKFSSRPDIMKYLNYKEINKLYDYSKTDMKLYNKIIKNTYADVTSSAPFDEADAIFFTTPISDYTSSPDKYIKLVEEYISKKYRKVIIKKHPRDKADYSFDGVECSYIPQTVPSETLFPCLLGKNLVFAEISSTFLNIPKDSTVECFYYNDLHRESIQGNTYEKYPDFEKFNSSLLSFELENLNIIKL